MDKKIDTDALRNQLKTLLENQSLGRGDNPESCQLCSMLNWGDAPKILLYRYYPLTEYALENISKSRITLVSPREFNDPYDAFPFFNFEALKKDFEWVTPEAVRGLLQNAKNGCLTEIQKARLGDEEDVSYFYQQIASIPEFDEAQLEEYASRAKYITESDIRSLIKMFQTQVRIACFSEQYDSMLMWGHYAQGHTGICVEYEMPLYCFVPMISVLPPNYAPVGNNISLLPVVYREERYDYSLGIVNYYKNLSYLRANLKTCEKKLDCWRNFRISCFKSKEWEYEKEWRMIESVVDAANTPRFHSIPFGKMTRIFLGCRISELNKKIVRNLIRTAEFPVIQSVPIFQTKLNESSQAYTIEVGEEVL